MIVIEIAKNFSPAPAGRFRSDGDFSGEAFREDHLRKALKNNDIVEVVLDGAYGYGSSFLDEAFGGLVRLGYFSPDDLGKRLKITARSRTFSHYKRLIEKYIAEAKLKID
jgi:hypothetical protein